MTYQELSALILGVSPLIESINLKDIFKQNYTFTITYRSKDKTLTNEEIAPIRKRIVSILEKKNIPLIGKLS